MEKHLQTFDAIAGEYIRYHPAKPSKLSLKVPVTRRMKFCEDVNDPVPNTLAANAFPGAHWRTERTRTLMQRFIRAAGETSEAGGGG